MVNVALFLLSDKASMINGVILPVYGGLTAQLKKTLIVKYLSITCIADLVNVALLSINDKRCYLTSRWWTNCSLVENLL